MSIRRKAHETSLAHALSPLPLGDPWPLQKPHLYSDPGFPQVLQRH